MGDSGGVRDGTATRQLGPARNPLRRSLRGRGESGQTETRCLPIRILIAFLPTLSPGNLRQSTIQNCNMHAIKKSDGIPIIYRVSRKKLVLNILRLHPFLTEFPHFYVLGTLRLQRNQ